jgi:hypothetical protein
VYHLPSWEGKVVRFGMSFACQQRSRPLGSRQQPAAVGSEPVHDDDCGLRGLQKWGTPELRERIAKKIDVVRAWLLRTAAKDPEDRVSRLWTFQMVGVSSRKLRSAIRELVGTQRQDGGWGQLDNQDSDAYATGSALVALHLAGSLRTGDLTYQRGSGFLLKSQRDDGSWYVKSRSKAFQVYFESGFPHGKDQFISMVASGWAVTTLALAFPSR